MEQRLSNQAGCNCRAKRGNRSSRSFPIPPAVGPGGEERRRGLPRFGQAFRDRVRFDAGREPVRGYRRNWNGGIAGEPIKARWGVGRMDYADRSGPLRPGESGSGVARPGERQLQDELRRAAERPARQGSLDPGPRYEGDQRLVRRRKGDLRDGGTGRTDRIERPERGRRPPVADPSPVGGAGRGRPHGQETLRIRRPLRSDQGRGPSGLYRCRFQGHEQRCASRPSRSRRGPS